MTKAIIIEDEMPSAHALAHTLYEIKNNIQVEAMLGTVAEAVAWLSQRHSVDIIFSDVQLPDGYSFEIFRKVEVTAPVIFTTAYNEYMMTAFEHNGIDYLLKPVEKQDLIQAMNKYETLEKHFKTSQPVLHRFAREHDMPRKNRLVVKKGLVHISLRIEEIVLFYTEHKIVFAVDTAGNKFMVDSTLAELETSLDGSLFFRANRQYIINLNFIHAFKTFDKVKMLLELSVPHFAHTIIISQENCAPFKEWIYNA
jgi:DNA-binding LytR/AlgR family response regulator